MAEFDRNLAVIIGINDYQEQLGIKKLKAARPDAEKLDKILYKQGYEVDLLVDEQATFDGITNFLTITLPEKIKTDGRVRLLFYFAGHGTTPQDEEGEAGYLIPQDAEPSNRDKFLSMRWVHDALTKLSCHHLLIILDCCFAGAFRFTTRHFGIIPEEISKQRYDRYIKHRAWQVITSAAHDQRAVDILWDNRGISEDSIHSPFAEALFKALEKQAADYTKDGITTATELYLYLNDVLLNQNPDKPQVPRFWPLKEHDKGEFIFLTGDFDQDKLPEAPALNENNNPYRGLESFDEAHSKFFFGREELVVELKQHLYLPARPFTVVLGVSGSGKSSLVKAGLIPKLREDNETKWRILEPIRPTADPFNALSRTMLSLVRDSEESEWQLLEQLDESLKQVRKRLPQDRDLGELLSNWRRSSSIDKLWLIIHHFEQLNKWFDRDADRRSLQNLRQIGLNRSQLVLEHFETLRAFLLSESERQQVEAFYQSCVDLLQTWSQNWKSDHQQFSHFVRDWCQSNSSWRLLLVVDQFEELVTQCDKDVREAFLDLLSDVLKDCPEQLRVVATLRADFEPRFIDSPQLKPYWDKARFLMRAMRSDELRRAIEEPASEHILYFETERDRNLVDQLIDEVGQMPGALPLLSFALSEIYREYVRQDDLQDRTLKWQHYRKVGGVAGSLTRRATEEFDRLVKDIDPKDEDRGGFGTEKGKAYQATMRRVMLRMVTIEGAELTRRQVSMSELVYPEPTENERVEKVINRLVNARLLVEGQERGNARGVYVEPAHDYLVRSWVQLKEWIEKEKEDLLLQRRITPAAAEWDSVKNKYREQPKGFLDVIKPVLNGLDLIFFSVEKIVSNAPDRFARLLRRDQNQQVRSREKPTQFLWDSSPYLGLLDKELHTDDNWLNQVEGKFVQESILQKRRNISWWWRGAIIIISVLSGLTILAEKSRKEAEYRATVAQLREQAARVLYLLPTSSSSQGLVLAIDTLSQIVKVAPEVLPSALYSLTQAVRMSPEQNLFKIRLRDGLARFESVSFSPDSKTIASIDQDGTMRLWNLQDQLLKEFKAHDHTEASGQQSVSFSPDGESLLSVGVTKDSTVMRLWSLQGDLIHEFKGNQSVISLASFSPNGQSLVSGSIDGSIQLWNRNGRLINEFKGSQKGIQSISFSPDGQNFVSAGIDDYVRIWSLKGQLFKEFKANQRGVKSVVFSPDSKHLATGGKDGNVKLWKLDGQPLRIFQGYQGSVYVKGYQAEIDSVAFSLDGKTIASSSEEGTVRLWSLSGILLSELNGHQAWGVSSVVFSPNGNKLASGGRDGTVRIWSLKGESLNKVDVNKGELRSVGFSPDGQTIATGGEDSTVRLWSLRGERRGEFQTQTKVKSVSFSPDGQTIVTGGEDGTLRLWSLSGERRGEFQAHQNAVHNVSFSFEGQTLISAGTDGIIREWDLSGKLLNEFKATEGRVWSVNFSPDRKTLASVRQGGTVQLWNRNGMLIEEFKLEPTATNLSFSRDGQTLASGGQDGIVRLWNLNGQPLGEFNGHQGSVWNTSFSPDGQILASVGEDGTLQLWPSGWTTWMEIACNRLKHHPLLNQPENVTSDSEFLKVAQRAKSACQQRVWKALEAKTH